MLTTAHVRIFLGSETSQVDGHSTEPAKPELYYYEPAGYEGDVLYSQGYDSIHGVVSAAAADASLDLVDGEWLSDALRETEDRGGWEFAAARELNHALWPAHERAESEAAALELARANGIAPTN